MIFAKNVKGSVEKLKQKIVAIAGCGGLGSNAAIALARSGVGRLKIADFDSVELSNLNRQHFFLQDVGKYKVDVLADSLKKINPEIETELFRTKLNCENVNDLFKGADILVEALDVADSKLWLIEKWSEFFPNKPIVCGSGIAGTGNFDEIRLRKMGNLYICGDQSDKTDSDLGFIAPKVAIVANLQALTVIKILLES